MTRDARSARRSAAAVFVLGLASVLLAGGARAETAWIKDELQLNLRTGPGTEYRIQTTLKTGDRVEILERGGSWTKVRAGERGTGWIPSGYLQPTAPASVALARREEQATDLQQRLDSLTAEADDLRSEKETLAARDGEQRDEIQRLTQENLELRAGARWPEWIAGACLLSAGMLIGAVLHRNSTRRPQKRIRL